MWKFFMTRTLGRYWAREYLDIGVGAVFNVEKLGMGLLRHEKRTIAKMF